MSIIINEINIKDKEDALAEGIWLTGKNKGIKINEITDVEYLQKILFTLQNRDKKLLNYVKSLSTTACLYTHIINRVVEIKEEVNLDFIPLKDHLDFFEEIKDHHEYILTKIK